MICIVSLCRHHLHKRDGSVSAEPGDHPAGCHGNRQWPAPANVGGSRSLHTDQERQQICPGLPTRGLLVSTIKP